jgi:hypothetical protein
MCLERATFSVVTGYGHFGVTYSLHVQRRKQLYFTFMLSQFGDVNYSIFFVKQKINH